MIKEHLSCRTLKSFVYDTFKTSSKIIIKSTGFNQPLSNVNPKLKLFLGRITNFIILLKKMIPGYTDKLHLTICLRYYFLSIFFFWFFSPSRFLVCLVDFFCFLVGFVCLFVFCGFPPLFFCLFLVEISLTVFILGWREVGLQCRRMRFLSPLQRISLKRLVYVAFFSFCFGFFDRTIIFSDVLSSRKTIIIRKQMPQEKYNRQHETKAFDLLCEGHWLKFDLGKQLISIIIWWLIWTGLRDQHTSCAKKCIKMDPNWHYCRYSQEKNWRLGRAWTVNCPPTSADCHWRARLESSNETAWARLCCCCPCCTCSVDKQTISFPRAVSIWHLSSEWNSLKLNKTKQKEKT